VAVVVDDLHFADSGSVALLGDLVALTDRRPLLVVAAMRPDPSSGAWVIRLRLLSDYAHRSVEVPLGPLGDDACLTLVRTWLPLGLDDDTVRFAVRRAEGNPLFLKETVRALVEAGDDRSRSWTLTVRPSDLVPPALEGLLLARIDRLPDGARRLAQAAAVVGRTFTVDVLREVGASPDLDADIAILLRAEIIRETRRFPALECTFTHGLLREAVLSTLTSARRRELFRRVAEASERLLGPSLGEHLDLLAQYYAEGDDLRKSLEYLERAAERAEALDAPDRASELWRRIVKVAGRLGDEGAAARARRALQAGGARAQSP